MTMRDTQQPYAIILGLESMQGLQVARILAQRKVPVIAIANNPAHHNCRTNVCDRILFSDTGTTELIQELEKLGPQLSQKAVLFPCYDKCVLLISQHRQQLAKWYHIVLPSPEVVEMMIDKVSFYAHAQERGLPIPKTFILRSRADAENAAESLTFPCVLKPPYRPLKWTKHTKAKALKALDKDELLALYDHYSRWADVLIAQKWIEGPDENNYSCNCYLNKATEPLVTFVARKLRQWPPLTGQSSLGQEVRNDIVLEETLRLFTGVDYWGLGYLEMKQDALSGEFFIVEPNIGRPTGRSAIAEAGRVELHYTMYCDAIGWSLPERREQSYGEVKWVHLLRDLQSSIYYWRQGELSLTEWWRSLRGPKAYAVFSWRDPLPFISALMRAIPTLLSPREQKKEDYMAQAKM